MIWVVFIVSIVYAIWAMWQTRDLDFEQLTIVGRVSIIVSAVVCIISGWYLADCVC